jgi:hypothetical protein
VEQKNWTHVRKLLGWERYDTAEAAEAISDLDGNELRLWLNLYLPSVKLEKKVRVGSKLRDELDPLELGGAIEREPERIYGRAERRLSPKRPSERSVKQQIHSQAR